MKNKMLPLANRIAPYVTSMSMIVGFVGLLFLFGVHVGVVGLYTISLTFLVDSICRLIRIEGVGEQLTTAVKSIGDDTITKNMPTTMRVIQFIGLVYYCALIATVGILGVKVILIIALIVNTITSTKNIMDVKKTLDNKPTT